MGRKDASSDIKEDLVMFCLATGVHGFAYLPNRQHFFATAIWVVAILVSIIWVSVICYQSFVHWGQNPVINVVETYTYDTSLVPMPAITMCPIQRMDSLYHTSVLLNQIQFRCMDLNGRNETHHPDLALCSEDHVKALRAEDSPFRLFLDELEEFIDEQVLSIGTNLIKACCPLLFPLRYFVCFRG